MTIAIVAYLWDYSLNVPCGGNKSELARKMGFRRTDINRMLKKLNEGAGSVRATEAVLKFMHQERCSLDQALAGYVECSNDLGNPVRMAYEGMAHMLREQMADDLRVTGAKMHILQSAEVFMEQLESAFCKNFCCKRRYSDAECPCKRFAEFIAWIQVEMEGGSASRRLALPNCCPHHSE